MARSRGATASATTRSLLPSSAVVDGTRRRLLEAALELFAARGYHGVSMRELAAATGVQPSSLYAHMPSKEQLLLDLVLLGHEEHRSGLRAAILDAGDDPARQLAACVRAHVGFHVRFPLLAIVANNELEALGPGGQREVRLVRGDAEALISGVVERGVRLGAFHTPDAWLATAAIGGMGIRTAVWFRPDGAYTEEQVAETYVDFALRIVGSTTS